MYHSTRSDFGENSGTMVFHTALSVKDTDGTALEGQSMQSCCQLLLKNTEYHGPELDRMSMPIVYANISMPRCIIHLVLRYLSASCITRY